MNCEECSKLEKVVNKAVFALSLFTYKSTNDKGVTELKQVRTEQEWKEWLLNED